MAQNETWTGRVSMGNVTVADQTFVPGETVLSPLSHLIVYTWTTLVEQTTFASHLVNDALASVSKVPLLTASRPRRPRWQGSLVAYVSKRSYLVLSFSVYLATSVAGVDR